MTDEIPARWFHLKDGWWFTRTTGGSVNIVKRKDASDNAEVIAAILIPWNEWASIVATVSRDGENHYGWYEAVTFHFEKEHDGSLKAGRYMNKDVAIE